MAATIISVINCKGGVGKTATTISLATSLREKRKKVLVVDIDFQADSTFILGVEESYVKNSHVGVALKHPEVFPDLIEEVVYFKKEGNKKRKRTIDLCPSHQSLKDVLHYLVVNDVTAKDVRLKAAIKTVKDNYDYILIDCGAKLALDTINALAASDYYIPIVDSKPLATKNLKVMDSCIEDVKYHNPELKSLGTLLTMYDHRKKLHRGIRESIDHHFTQLKKENPDSFENLPFKTNIPDNIEVAECTLEMIPLCQYAPRSKGHQAYLELTEEIIKRVKKGRE